MTLAPTNRPASPAPSAAPGRGRSRRSFVRNVSTVLAGVWLLGIVCAAAFADVLPLAAPDVVSGVYALPPFADSAHPLGTDQLGRDQLSRAVHGARVSLSVGLGATLIALVIGLVAGVLAGYRRGFLDAVFGVSTNVVLAFPPLILLIAVVAVFPANVFSLTAGLALVAIPGFARIARANTLAFANREFVTAAKALGARSTRIMIFEIVPNLLLPLFSLGLVIAAGLIVAEGSLSFIGLGVPAPAPSWGGMVSLARERLAGTPYLVGVPAAFFFLTVYSLNQIGDWAQSRAGKESSL